MASFRRRRDLLSSMLSILSVSLVVCSLIVFRSSGFGLFPRVVVVYFSPPTPAMSSGSLSSSLLEKRLDHAVGVELFSSKARRSTYPRSSSNSASTIEIESIHQVSSASLEAFRVFSHLIVGSYLTLTPLPLPQVFDSFHGSSGFLPFLVGVTEDLLPPNVQDVAAPALLLASHRPPLSFISQGSFAGGQRKLGFSFLGLSHLGPFGFSSWPTFESGGLFYYPRPLSDLKPRLTIACCGLSRHNSSKYRGHILKIGVVSTQVLAGFYLITWPRSVLNFLVVNPTFAPRRYIVTLGRGLLVWSMSVSVQGLISHQSIEFKQVQLPLYTRVRSISVTGVGHFHVFLFAGFLNLSRIYSSKEKSSTLSSSLEERSIPLPSLFLRGEPCPQVAWKSALTALHSCVMVYTGPEDATELIPVRTEVWFHVLKSHGKVTPFKSFERVGLKFVSLMLEVIFGHHRISSHAISNSFEFVYLSLYCLFASIALFSCFTHQVCLMMSISYVID